MFNKYINSPRVCKIDIDELRKLLNSVSPDELVELLRPSDNLTKTTVIHRAVKMNHLELLAELLEFAKLSESYFDLVKSQDSVNSIPMHIATESNKWKAIELMLDTLGNEAKLELIKMKNSMGLDCWYSAVHYNCVESIEALLSSISVDDRVKLLKFCPQQMSPVYTAAEKGNLKSVKVMLQSIPVNAKIEILNHRNDHGCTIVHYAAAGGQSSIIEAMLQHIPGSKITDVLKVQSRNRETAIHHAASGGHVEAIAAMLNCIPAEERADVLTVQSTNGETAFHNAAQNGYVEAITAMLNSLSKDENSEIFQMQNRDGYTALHCLSVSCPNSADVDSILDQLPIKGRLELLLIECSKGESAEQLAKKSGDNNVAECLQKHKQATLKLLGRSTSISKFSVTFYVAFSRSLFC